MKKYLNLRANIAFGLIFAFWVNTCGPICPIPLAQAQVPSPAGGGFRLPAPGVMVYLSPAFTPAHLVGMTIHPDNALQFDFLIHRGDNPLSDEQKKEEYNKLIKYFLASLTLPDNDQWVNLSPYEHNRIITDNFGKTEMGRDLLGQDYLLKQITSSLIYPEKDLGRRFWDLVYERAWKEYGTTNIPVNTFNKVWIIPDQAALYESGNTVYILRDHLKVMLEEDYLSLNKHRVMASAAKQSFITHTVASKIIKEIILPALEKEVNEGKNFAQLRQIYSGMILATWYKHVFKESLLGKIYANHSKVKGVDQNPKNNEQIYQGYLKAFKKGVFNYIKEDADKYTNEIIPRKYFSGGIQDFSQMVTGSGVNGGFRDAAVLVLNAFNTDVLPSSDRAIISSNSDGNAQNIDRVTTALGQIDAAMTAEDVLENFRSHPQKENVGISEQGLNSSDIESVELAQQRLGGLVNDFIVANDGDQKVILQEKLLSLRDAVKQKLNQRDLSGVRDLLSQIFGLNLSLFKRGIIYQDFSYDSFAVRMSGKVVITDMRGFKNFYSKEAIRNWDTYIRGMGASLRRGVPEEVSGILSEIGLNRKFFKHLLYTPHFVRQYLPIVLDVIGIKKRIRALIPNENTVRRNSTRIDTEQALRSIADKLTVQQEVQSGHQAIVTSSSGTNGAIIIEKDSDITLAPPEDFIDQQGAQLLELFLEDKEDLLREIAHSRSYRSFLQENSGDFNLGSRYVLSKLDAFAQQNGSPDFRDFYRKNRATQNELGGGGILAAPGSEPKFSIGITENRKLIELDTSLNLEDLKIKVIPRLKELFSPNNRDAVINSDGYRYLSMPGIYRFKLNKSGTTYSIYVRYFEKENTIIIVGYGPQHLFKMSGKNGTVFKSGAKRDLLNFSTRGEKRIRTYDDFVKEYGVLKLDAAMSSSIPKSYSAFIQSDKRSSDRYGGIDLNSSNLNLQIKRDGKGVPLPMAQQNMARLNRIRGFVPYIIEIKPAAGLPIFSELQQKLQSVSG